MSQRSGQDRDAEIIDTFVVCFMGEIREDLRNKGVQELSPSYGLFQEKMSQIQLTLLVRTKLPLEYRKEEDIIDGASIVSVDVTFKSMGPKKGIMLRDSSQMLWV